MGSVFRKTTTRPIPAGATIARQGDKPVAPVEVESGEVEDGRGRHPRRRAAGHPSGVLDLLRQIPKPRRHGPCRPDRLS